MNFLSHQESSLQNLMMDGSFNQSGYSLKLKKLVVATYLHSYGKIEFSMSYQCQNCACSIYTHIYIYMES